MFKCDNGFIVTWERIVELETTNQNTFQLVFAQNSEFAFVLYLFEHCDSTAEYSIVPADLEGNYWNWDGSLMNLNKESFPSFKFDGTQSNVKKPGLFITLLFRKKPSSRSKYAEMFSIIC